jgi:hypothetical protein
MTCQSQLGSPPYRIRQRLYKIQRYTAVHRTVTRPYSQNPGLWRYGDGYRRLSYGALWEYGLNIYSSHCKQCIWAYKICIRLVSFTWSVQKFKLTLIKWFPFIFLLVRVKSTLGSAAFGLVRTASQRFQPLKLACTRLLVQFLPSPGLVIEPRSSLQRFWFEFEFRRELRQHWTQQYRGAKLSKMSDEWGSGY